MGANIALTGIIVSLFGYVATNFFAAAPRQPSAEIISAIITIGGFAATFVGAIIAIWS